MRILVTGLLLALLSPITPALAQDAWPQKSVRFIVGFAPGGSVDPIARVTGQALSEKWK